MRSILRVSQRLMGSQSFESKLCLLGLVDADAGGDQDLRAFLIWIAINIIIAIMITATIVHKKGLSNWFSKKPRTSASLVFIFFC